MSALRITLISLLILIKPSYSQVICTDTPPCECTDETTKCKLKCQQDDTCSTPPEYLLQCASNQACDIDCIGNNTCSNALVLAHDATDLFISCKYGIAPCVGTTVYCGSGHCSIRCKLTAPGSCVGINIVPGNALSFECLGDCPQSLFDEGFSAAPTAVTLAPSTSPTLAPSQAPSSPPSAAPTINPSIAPFAAPSFAPTNNPSMDSSSPSEEPSETPSRYPSIAPVTALPTLSPVPTTAVPTDSPVTKIPTISPVQEGEVIEVSTTVIVVVNDEDDDGSSDSTTVDNATIGMIIAVCAVGCCILIGAGILHNKRKDVSDDEGDFTAKHDVYIEGNAQQLQMHQQSDKQLSPVYTPDGVVKQEGYLSKAQKQELYSTAQGPRTDDVDEWERDEPCIDYLSAAQREELKKNGMNTAGNKVDNEYLSAAQKEELKKLTPGKINVQLQKEESEHLSDDDVVANLTPGIDTSSSHPEWKHRDEVQHVIVGNVKNEGSETNEVQIEDKMTIGVHEILDDEYDVQYDDEVEEDDEDDDDNYETMQ